jgi:cell division control protein 7
MAATVVRRRTEELFDIHEDARTEDTEMMDDEDVAVATAPDEAMDHVDAEAEEEEEEEDQSSDDDQVEGSVQADMDKLSNDFPGFRGKYRLIKRIGEGGCCPVYSFSPKVFNDIAEPLTHLDLRRNILYRVQSRRFPVRKIRQ